MQIYTLNTFGELAVTCTPPPPPPSEWSILTRIPYIFPVFTPKFDRLVCATVCMPMSSQLRGWWVRVCSVRTKVYGALIPIRSLHTGLRCRSNNKTFNEFSTLPSRCD